MPSFTSETYTTDNLLAGDAPIVTEEITLLSGENRTRGAVLGKITVGAVTGAADGGNTGDGVLSGELAGEQTKVGVYTATCIAAAANAGTFEVKDPDGVALEDATVAVAYSNEHLAFTIADGAADFVVGDKFTFTVAAGSDKYKLSVKTAVDGSNHPLAILAEDIDASAADVVGTAYLSGEFNENKLTFGTGHTAASTKDELRGKGIFVKSAQAA